MSTVSIHDDFAAELERARQSAGISLRELASRAGTSHPYVIKVLRGEIWPSLDQAERLAAAVGLKLRLGVTKAKKSRARG